MSAIGETIWKNYMLTLKSHHKIKRENLCFEMEQFT